MRVEEAYDSNVFLQDSTDLGNRDSMVTVLQPSLEIGWKSAPLNVDFGYQPRISLYQSESGENNQAHAFTLNCAGGHGALAFDLTNAFTVVNGPDKPPLYTGQGGLPAIAGFAVRDRRDALWLKQGAKVTWKGENTFVRAVYSGYIHDFRAQQRDISGYCNYVDRQNFNGGLDAGYRVWPNTWAVAGYRCGEELQDDLFERPLNYSNRYQRLLLGVEGQPAKWIKLSVLAGPSFHEFTEQLPEGFGRDHTKLYIDGTLSLMPTAHDSFQLTLSRFEQMASGGCAAYEDIVYKVGYNRVLSRGLDLKAEFKVYRGEFEPSAVRDDTIYTPAIGLNWKLKHGFILGANYAYEWAESDVPETPAREYHRHYVALSFSGSF